MKIGVLTSSRSDFGIYYPLLEKMDSSVEFDLEIIAFGTHLSKFHGYSVVQIRDAGFTKIHELSSILTNDDESSISTTYGLTALKFAEFWKNHSYDWVFCLGDRFEMAAAVQAGIPFGVKFAHIHGGETTLGAIDNIYRHQISLAAKKHFPVIKEFGLRIQEIIGSKENIHPVGSLSIDGLADLPIPSKKDFLKKFSISRKEFVLMTFHPETVAIQSNQNYVDEMLKAISAISEKELLVITMPNADTLGSLYRDALIKLKKGNSNIVLVENFGRLNYFAAMSFSKLLIGNTSSGIIEAASFGKYVINVGNRQQGRSQSGNVMNVPFDHEKIIDAYFQGVSKGDYIGKNIYHKPGTAALILEFLKES